MKSAILVRQLGNIQPTDSDVRRKAERCERRARKAGVE